MNGFITTLFFLCVVTSPLVSAQLWQVKSRVNPKFPSLFIKDTTAGCVSVQFFVNEHGKTQFVEVLDSRLNSKFGLAAIEAVKQWRYEPTFANMDKSAERKSVDLAFAVGDAHESYISDCNTSLTSEPNSLSAFREQRLQHKLDDVSVKSIEAWLAKTKTVLSDQETNMFMKKIALITGYSDDDEFLGDADFSQLLTLDYWQVMALETEGKAIEKQNVATSLLTKRELMSLPVTPLVESLKLWNLIGFPVNMPAELYDEFGYHLLELEVGINLDGSAQLLRTCRDINKKALAHIESSVEDWSLPQVSKTAKAIKLRVGLPAPIGIVKLIGI